MRAEQIFPALEFAALIVVSKRGLTREQKKRGLSVTSPLRWRVATVCLLIPVY